MTHKAFSVVVAILSIFVTISLIAPKVSYACNNGVKHNTGDPCGSSTDTAVGSIMVHVGGFSVASTPLMLATGGTAVEYRLPRDGFIQNMRVFIQRNTFGTNATVTVFAGGVEKLSAVIPAGSTADIDVAGSEAVSDGDAVFVLVEADDLTSSGSLVLSVSYEIK